MSELRTVNDGHSDIALPAGDLPPQKLFAHPDEVVDDQALTLAEKRSLLASWASDACAVEGSPSLRQLTSGAVVRVDDIMAALKSLDRDEFPKKSLPAFHQSFSRRRSKPTVSRRSPRPEDDDEPPPFAAGAAIPTPRKMLIGMRPAGGPLRSVGPQSRGRAAAA